MHYPTALLALLLLAQTGGAARAQTAAPKPARVAQPTPPLSESAKGYCLMKDGEVLLVKNGKMAPMTATLTMADGSLCMPDGTCQRPDGRTVLLKEGQSMLMSGQLSMHPDQGPDYAPGQGPDKVPDQAPALPKPRPKK